MAKLSKRPSPQKTNQKTQRPRSEEPPEDPRMELLSRSQLLLAMAATALVLLVIARIWLFFEPVLLPVSLRWQSVATGMAVGLAISVTSLMIYKFWPAYRRSADYYLAFVLSPLLLVDSIWVGLLPGLSEELLFRGVLLPAIGLNATGLVVSSACFGALHMSSLRQWPYAVWAIAIGFILGGSALVTGNLLVPIAAHVTTNFLSSFFWQYQARTAS